MSLLGEASVHEKNFTEYNLTLCHECFCSVFPLLLALSLFLARDAVSGFYKL